MPERLRPLVAGNWKMNGRVADLAEIAAIRAAVAAGEAGGAEILVCPPATLLLEAARLCAGSPVAVGAQDCHPAESGPHTGDISAEMLKDAGPSYVIVGHSERRSRHSETNEVVRAKAAAAMRAGLTAIVCVGETHHERRAGRAVEIVSGQLLGSLPPFETPASLVVAYEPIWAIGTGIVPTAGYVAETHAAIRARLGELFGEGGGLMRILYGGSVKPSNARELMRLRNVDGALVGGASLKAKDFLGIAGSYG